MRVQGVASLDRPVVDGMGAQQNGMMLNGMMLSGHPTQQPGQGMVPLASLQSESMALSGAKYQQLPATALRPLHEGAQSRICGSTHHRH